jgi:hypothetical protein
MASGARPSTQKLLEEARQLSLPELEKFVAELIALRAQRLAPSLTRAESELFMTINMGFSSDRQARFIELVEKRRAERITQEELDELISLADEAEKQNVKRIEALGELARLRGVSLTDLMDALGIKPPPVL